MKKPPVAKSETANDKKLSMLKRVSHTVTLNFSVDEWINLIDHDRQRDTERRLNYACNHHFREASPTHAIVEAIHYNGVLHKGNGHTRAEAWKRGLLERPSALTLITYHCETEQDYLELYRHFDSLDAVERNTDILSGALRQNGIVPRSSLVKTCNWAGALRIATRCFGASEISDIYLNVDEFASEIRALDDRNYSARDLSRGVTAGYFILRRKHGGKIDAFFDKVAKREGIKDGSNCDGVHLLDQLNNANKAGSGQSLTLPMTEWTITCGELWLAGKSVKLYKEPHVKDKDGKVYVVPRYANVDPIKLSGYLKGLKRT